MSTAAKRRLTVLALGTLLVALTASACGGSVTKVVEGSSLKPAPDELSVSPLLSTTRSL